ncbi:MAG TPA: hypothetical protein VKP30_07385 [Polyangiaceae bacterium]|nr:hypothetical protein [Polyangiaceae bacterium]
MVEPLTLARFAKLTARLEQSESRQAILDQEGLSLQHWLSEQRRWLEEMSKRIALNRPRLFHHYCALVEAERERLGCPPLMGRPSTPKAPRRAPVAGTEMTAPNAPEASLPQTASGGVEAPPAEPRLPNASLDVPVYLRATSPLAPPAAGPLCGFPNTPPVSGAAIHAPLRSAGAEPRSMPQSNAPSSAEPTVPPGLEFSPSGPNAGMGSFSRSSEPPRLEMPEYVELTVLLEQTSTVLGASVLSRFGLDYGEWVDEVAYWNRQFTEKRLDPKTFERLLAIQRAKSP